MTLTVLSALVADACGGSDANAKIVRVSAGPGALQVQAREHRLDLRFERVADDSSADPSHHLTDFAMPEHVRVSWRARARRLRTDADKRPVWLTMTRPGRAPPSS